MRLARARVLILLIDAAALTTLIGIALWAASEPPTEAKEAAGTCLVFALSIVVAILLFAGFLLLLSGLIILLAIVFVRCVGCPPSDPPPPAPDLRPDRQSYPPIM